MHVFVYKYNSVLCVYVLIYVCSYVCTIYLHTYVAPVDDATIQHYVATGEPLGCAGAFALEGRGGLLIDAIEGCASNVMGLSLPWLRHHLVEWGFSLAALWSLDTSGKKAP